MPKLFALLLLGISFTSYAQSSFRVGPLGSYFENSYGLGGELIATADLGSYSLGMGAHVIKMEKGGTMPVTFITLGHQLTPFLTFHIDPGYNLYSKIYQINGLQYKTVGSYYIGSGFTFYFQNKFYLNTQYSLFTTKSKNNNVKSQTSGIHAVTVSFGYSLKTKKG